MMKNIKISLAFTLSLFAMSVGTGWGMKNTEMQQMLQRGIDEQFEGVNYDTLMSNIRQVNKNISSVTYRSSLCNYLQRAKKRLTDTPDGTNFNKYYFIESQNKYFVVENFSVENYCSTSVYIVKKEDHDSLQNYYNERVVYDKNLQNHPDERVKTDANVPMLPKSSWIASSPCLTASLSISAVFILAWIIFLIFHKLNSRYPQRADTLMASTSNKFKYGMGWLMKNAHRFNRYWAVYLIGLVGINGLAALADWGIRRYRLHQKTEQMYL